MIILNIVAVAVIVAIVFFALLGPLANQQNQSYKSSNTYVPEDSYSSSSNNRPKISAEVSDSLYDDVRSYCAQNYMSISELMRISVRTYMDEH